MKNTWVVVADEAIARILEQSQQGGDLVPVEELTDPDAHAKESELHHGPHGRRAGGGSGSNPQATVSAGDSERHQRAQLFATRIAQRLAQGHRDKRFEALHLVAAPRLLGYLRNALDANVAGTVVGTLDKDVVQESNAELARRVFGSQAPTT
jgi:protein required for attachment to host cells